MAKNTYKCLYCGKEWQTTPKGYQAHKAMKHGGGYPLTSDDRTRALARMLAQKNGDWNEQHTDEGHGQYC